MEMYLGQYRYAGIFLGDEFQEGKTDILSSEGMAGPGYVGQVRLGNISLNFKLRISDPDQNPPPDFPVLPKINLSRIWVPNRYLSINYIQRNTESFLETMGCHVS